MWTECWLCPHFGLKCNYVFHDLPLTQGSSVVTLVFRVLYETRLHKKMCSIREISYGNLPLFWKPNLVFIGIFSFKGCFSYTLATTRFGHSTPVIESERTVPRLTALCSIEPGDCQCCIAAATYWVRYRDVTVPRAPAPSRFQLLRISVAGLTQDASDHGSSVMTIIAMQRYFLRTFINPSHTGLRPPLLSGGSSRTQRRRCAFNTWGQRNPAIWIWPPSRLLYVSSTTLLKYLYSFAEEIPYVRAAWGLACTPTSQISPGQLHRLAPYAEFLYLLCNDNFLKVFPCFSLTGINL